MFGMNYQEMTDKIVHHLLSMDKRSVNKNGNCRYRGPKGSMCAIGFLIPDDKYKKSFEQNSIEDISHHFNIDSNESRFLQEFQYIHDREANWKHIRTNRKDSCGYFIRKETGGLNIDGLRQLMRHIESYNLIVPKALTDRLAKM
jgi:hypothetical protein